MLRPGVGGVEVIVEGGLGRCEGQLLLRMLCKYDLVIYIYIYIERERDIDIYVYIYIYIYEVYSVA